MTIMNNSGLLSLPTELLQQVAICAPATRDVLALASSNSVLHGAIAISLVFQTRVRDAGWDTKTWEEEARNLPGEEGE